MQTRIDQTVSFHASDIVVKEAKHIGRDTETTTTQPEPVTKTATIKCTE